MNPYSYPTVFEVLQITAVLLSTSFSCEGSILSLRHWEDYTQSTMKSDRLNGLASMYFHRDIYINPSFVLNKFVFANPNRRANFRIVDWFRKVWNIIVIFILLLLVFWYWCCCNILQQYVPPLYSYYSEKEGSSGSSMFSFYVDLSFSRMLPSFSSKYFLSFCVFVIQ